MDNVYHTTCIVTAAVAVEDYMIKWVPGMDTLFITKSKLSLRLSSTTLKWIFLPEEKLALNESATTNFNNDDQLF
jgi:hypothetical protein